MTHTPGPWAISPTKHRTLIVSGLGFQVAAAEDLSAADAVLICAAPAMLAALERVQALLTKGTHLGGTAEDFHQYRQTCDAVKAAIRVATGEA